ncbi:cytochrome c biogenesis heme-transporting ATPase CcmA [Caldimonas brevitalea]|uniref:cytochrome c biogenesis heme-transporting ATPase CcmA n=1 Tax=Caldimonas brevitalea TaxID=413882 RepID=UPI001EED5D51|nr:cytochrome c biogenesis heme-transporting ATPase CcmA [Caldimonas brevitalea]
MSHAEPPRLATVQLACRRAGRLLFQALDLQVPAGQVVWVRGRNGSGKTSLLRLAAGLVAPEAGQVLWGGVPVREGARAGARPAFVGHAHALQQDFTVTQALQFLLRLQGGPSDTATVHGALHRMGLQGHRETPVRSLSQGQRRRAALARLAVPEPAPLWLLDEPYDALDADGIERLNALLCDQLLRGGSVLLTSHQAVDLGPMRVGEIDLDGYH